MPSQEAALLAKARARTAPLALRTRFGFKIESEAVDGSTGGALIVDRPGKGHLAVMGPLGPLVTLHTDGVGLAVSNRRDRSHLVAADAEGAVRGATDGLAGVDEVLGLLVGEVPLDGLEVSGRTRNEAGNLRLTLKGPQDVTVDLVLNDPLATPVSLRVIDREGAELLIADYGAFEAHRDAPDTWLPTEVSVQIPRFKVSLDVRFRRWDLLGEEIPAVFGLEAPEGFTEGVLEIGSIPGAETPMR